MTVTDNRVDVWVTGGGGFMGGHLVEMLGSRGDRVLATSFRPTAKGVNLEAWAIVEQCDLRDRQRVRELYTNYRPTRIFHLAAQSYPTTSWENPRYTLESNVIGTVNLFEAVKETGADCKILNACSSAEYGLVSEDDVPVTEEHGLKPLHPYGVSKVAQEMLAYQYFKNFQMKPVSVRIFNTTGPRKVNDVCADLTKRVVEIEKGQNVSERLRVGNLSAKRAIMDVRDCIEAFVVALEKGEVGEVYNLSGDRVYGVAEIVETLRELSVAAFEVWQDPELLRPTDEPIIWGDTVKFRRATGWKPTISLEETLSDMLDHWRKTL